MGFPVIANFDSCPFGDNIELNYPENVVRHG